MNIKEGDVQKEGAYLSPKLIEIATAIQSSVPGFGYFSGFNDKFHQENASGSKHTSGVAADFTLKTPPDKKTGDDIVAKLKQLGASYVQNEYANPSGKATGGHFHIEVPQFENGGMMDGIGLVGEKGPELAVGAGSITSNNDIMGAFRMMTAELSAQSMILSEIARATKSSSTTSEKMLRYAQN